MKINKKSMLIMTLALLASGTGSAVTSVYGEQTGAEEMSGKAEAENALPISFDEALEKGEIEVWFQPIVDPVTETVFGAEALSRWNHEGEYISPGVFVPVLEETGQVHKLDLHAFEEAVRFQKERQEAGSELFPISVNLSPESAMREGAASEYGKRYKESGLPEGLVSIEITESMETDSETIYDLAYELASQGFALEIDDFGAGYAAYADLAVIDYDILKIDKSLVDGIGTERGEQLLTGIISLAQELDMKTIAEGVETEEQVLFLKEKGCSAIQGYYYSPALPEEEFLEYLAGITPAE